jgi:hypothetical protein
MGGKTRVKPVSLNCAIIERICVGLTLPEHRFDAIRRAKINRADQAEALAPDELAPVSGFRMRVSLIANRVLAGLQYLV